MEVSSQGAALLNGSDADGGSLNSGTGCINTRRERETEEEAEGGRASLERRVGAARDGRLLVGRLAGAASGVVRWSCGTGGRNERSRLLVLRLVGAESGVVCWSCRTGGRIERSRLLVMGWWAQ